MQNNVAEDNPPIFNLPQVILVVSIILVASHIIRVWVVPQSFGQDFILLFAAIPARYGDLGGSLPYSFAAWYTPLTHAFLHADWGHLTINLAWMLAFGSPVAMRFGTLRFLALSGAGALMAFGFHLITHINDFVPMLGASGAISAYMGAAIRLPRNADKSVLPLIESFKNRGFLAFVLVWFAINLLVGLQPGLIADDETQIAWQAHVGGFLTGLVMFHLFDPDNTSTIEDG